METLKQLHRLLVTEDKGTLFYQMLCPGITDSCRAYEECDCPQSKVSEEYGDTWIDFFEEKEVHGVIHKYIDGFWMRPLEVCFPSIDMYLAEAARDAGIRSPGEYLVKWRLIDGPDEFIELEVVEK